jgi:hypothetical protein
MSHLAYICICHDFMKMIESHHATGEVVVGPLLEFHVNFNPEILIYRPTEYGNSAAHVRSFFAVHVLHNTCVSTYVVTVV